MLRLIGTLSCIWLVIAISSVAAQPSNDSFPPVLDTTGQPLESGVEYYILPGVTDIGGGLTLIDRNGSCPLYVGQENVTGNELPVIFTPFFAGETIIRESRDFSVAFSAATICIQSTAWRVGETDPETQRRFIVTGGDKGYFRIIKNGPLYNIQWCPTDVCPLCRLRCGVAGPLIENGKRLLALDGPALPVVFRRA